MIFAGIYSVCLFENSLYFSSHKSILQIQIFVEQDDDDDEEDETGQQRQIYLI